MDDFSSLVIIFYTVLFNLIEQVRISIALVVAVLGALYLWHQSVANLGSTKMLRDFTLVRVLKRTDTELALLGKFKSDRHKNAAVLIIQTATMDMQILNQLIVNLIYPATDLHVRKHTDQNFYMVVETKEAYRKITKPYIDSIPPDSIYWVYNILEHKSEMDRIIYEDIHPRNGFVLLPDIKWSDLSQLESLYCLAILGTRLECYRTSGAGRETSSAARSLPRFLFSALATVAAESARLDTDEVSCPFAAAIVQSSVDSALDIVPHEARGTKNTHESTRETSMKYRKPRRTS
ncbi:hypothetical protein PsorP6_016919 [Peronosclerospora sorghi]|uniref:Uncharacterized protein n=1 Tax=Peronosclerospora sorghi TaxID=230839 RepID=A0ACC0WCF2_9STRA|nr:hypothetical protein PsorP6_016919 [Peronosclerospora sorghi]